MSKEREKIPWASTETTDQRVTELSRLVTIRTTFGLGGVRTGQQAMVQGDRESALHAEAAARRLLARAICLDWTLLAGDTAAGIIFPEVTTQEAAKSFGKKRSKQKPLAEAESLLQEGTLAAWYAGAQALRDSTQYSIFGELCDPISYLSSHGDLGSLFFDPAVRRAMQVATHNVIEFVHESGAIVSFIDRWYLRPVPATLFELRVLKEDGDTVAHMASSYARLNELLYKILPNLAVPEQTVSLHVASIERSSLLSPAQEQAVISAPAVTQELLGAWSAKDQFYVDRAVAAAPLPPAVRAQIEPDAPEGSSPDLPEDWALMREMFESAGGSGGATYQTYMATLTRIAEAVLAARYKRVTDQDPSPLVQNFTDEQLWDAIGEVASFLRSTGARMQETTPDGTGSRLNLLAYVEREIENRKRLDPLNPTGIGMRQGWIDYLDLVYDVIARCALFGLFRPPKTDIPARMREVLAFFYNQPTDPDQVARRPLSELWAEILDLNAAGPGFTWLQGEQNSSEAGLVFRNILTSVGKLQEFLPDCLQTGRFPGKGGRYAHPLDLWRFYLEVEFRLNKYVSQKDASFPTRKELHKFSREKAFKYISTTDDGSDARRLLDAGARMRQIYDEGEIQVPAKMSREMKIFWEALLESINAASGEAGFRQWGKVLGALGYFYEERLGGAGKKKAKK